MDTVTRNVGDMGARDREVLEHLLGQSLRDDQKLVIRIESAGPGPAPTDETGAPANHSELTLPSWCNVYAGLSDEEIGDLEKIILSRANLARPSE